MLINNVLQWVGAAFIIAGHVLNAMGADGYNIAAFTVGTLAFMAWAIRVANKPQTLVNVVAIAVCAVGLFRAYG
jgi:predicted membrane chloride channel (bestrophin family)